MKSFIILLLITLAIITCGYISEKYSNIKIENNLNENTIYKINCNICPICESNQVYNIYTFEKNNNIYLYNFCKKCKSKWYTISDNKKYIVKE